MFTDIVILAGGIGERLWPLSTKAHPKQFIETPDGSSFFQMSLKRALLLMPAHSILVITRRDFEAITIAQCQSFLETLSAEQAAFFRERLTVLLEPVPRHTAAAVQYAASYLSSQTEQKESSASSILVLTSDHIISTDEQFVSNCQSAFQSVQENYFVCFAVPPSFPSTGFGYIETGKAVNGQKGVYEIHSFREKPDEQTAGTFLDKGNYWWNSGMFAFNKDFYMDEIKKYTPELDASFSALSGVKPVTGYCQNVKIVREWAGIESVYDGVVSVSIDTAIAEKTGRSRCVIAEFGWDDVGSWDAFADCIPSRQENAVLVESDNCSVYSDIPVAVCGVQDVVVAIKDGKALVMRKGKSHLVRDAVRNIPQ
jgi:mannose-1-phosphate guanylyltransferase/mannose-6-phosphate isomerase